MRNDSLTLLDINSILTTGVVARVEPDIKSGNDHWTVQGTVDGEICRVVIEALTKDSSRIRVITAWKKEARK